MKKLSVYFLLVLILVACNSTKHVAKNEHMLTKNYIFVDSVKYKSSDLQKYILQKPNPRLLNLPLGLYFHNLGNHDKPKTPSEWGKENPKKYKFIKNVFSEKQSIAYANSLINLNNWFLSFDSPVIVNKNKVERTSDNLWAYYKTKGFFKSKVKAIIKRDSSQKKATVEYYITKGKPTLLDTIKFKIESPVLDSIYKASGITSLLKTGDQYNDKTFRKEAANVVKLYKNNGIYYFTESALGFYLDSMDSIKKNYKTNVDFLISRGRLEEKDGTYKNKDYKVQKIKEVVVRTDYSYTQKDEEYSDSITYKGIKFYGYNKIKYNPKYLAQSIFFKPGDIYKDTLRNLTRSHLKSLKNFKTTNLDFTSVGNTGDELRLDVFLSPKEKYTLGFDTELTHSNIREIGTSAKFSIIDRNAFRGAEILKLSFLGSYFRARNGPGYEIGADISLEIPRFVAPFGLNKLVPKAMSPKTRISIGASLQKNIGLDRQTITTGIDYKWNYTPKKTIQIEGFNLQYIANLNISQYFTIYGSEFDKIEVIKNNFFPNENLSAATAEKFVFKALTDSNFATNNPKEYLTLFNIANRYSIITSNFIIPTISYSYTYNSQTNFKDNNFSFFKFKITNSGNVVGLLSNKKDDSGAKTIAGTPIAQYFKTDIEYKKFWEVSDDSVIGFRSFFGLIIPYGKSDIPFSKSYFAGGSNDIRAWRSYDLGPGSFPNVFEFNTGSLKLLTSLEYRFNVVGDIKGALFLDAGNVWDISKSLYDFEDANFTGFSSLKDIALGSGFGIRYDLNFLVLRLDLGFKTYEPYLKENKWFENYNFRSAVYNIGINYPF
ncbi:BamA/TamA family outer membrane protein [Polaribacter cellanae]|uniref:BamA/TamA family outer membrane protein n=2 Tax=Polaribacter cellanae TaxID=2818493 RepID=A0A975CT62_9FLAO|nr:BamA/TamA family outer membrane protein [Polaribacter cellanae]